MERRRLLWPAIATVIGCAVLVGLGIWQLQRLQWKQTLIERVTDRMTEEPVPLPLPSEWGEAGFLDEWEYRPVVLRGAFQRTDAPDRAGSQVVYSFANVTEPNGPLGGLGYWVMNAFYPDTGGTVYVNRGFIPAKLLQSEPPPPDGPLEIVGLLLPSQPGNFATPDCETDKPICYTRDVHRFAAAEADQPAPVAPFFVDLQAEGGNTAALPQAGETRVSFPNNHLQYALTWFGLALGLAGVFAVFARRR